MSLLIDLPDLGVKLKLNAGELNVTVPNPDRKDEYKLTGNLKIGKVVTSGLSMTGMLVQDLTLSDLRFDEKTLDKDVTSYNGQKLTLKSCVCRNNTNTWQDHSATPMQFNTAELKHLVLVDCDTDVCIGATSGIDTIEVINTVKRAYHSNGYHGGHTFAHVSGINLCKTVHIIVLESAGYLIVDSRPRPFNETSRFPVNNLLLKDSHVSDQNTIRYCQNFHGSQRHGSMIEANMFVFAHRCVSYAPGGNGNGYNVFDSTVHSESGIVLETQIENVKQNEVVIHHPNHHSQTLNGFKAPRGDSHSQGYTAPVRSFAWYQRMTCTGTLDIPVAIRMIGLTPEVAEIVNRLSA